MPARLLSILFSFLLMLILSTHVASAETFSKGVSVLGRQPWTDTGIDVSVDKISIIDIKWISGQVYYAYFSQPPVSPTGKQGCVAGIIFVLPGATCYSLIGRIGNGSAFPVNMIWRFPGFGFAELGATFTAMDSGPLYLGVNDEIPFFADNLGAWHLQVVINTFPKPTPSGPTPFLDLPWDYQGLSFSDAALAINAFFDHEYPLLSSGLGESEGTNDSIIIYKGPPRSTDFYSSHDGYDYGRAAKANLGDPVLAAADGCGSYHYSTAGGNVISIDHGNRYQTRYLHLQTDGLITENATPCVDVTKGEQIGKVGATGNVIPSGEAGAHIHFMVIEDKNKDGNFDDNIPDGVTDPFGWQSKEPDPWPSYSFFYNEQDRTGNKSYYLWTKKLDSLSTNLTSGGGTFQSGKFTISFPSGSTNQTLTLDLTSSPIANTSAGLASLGSTITVTATDALGNIVKTFQNLFTVTTDFSSVDLSRYDIDTLSIYSSGDGINWTMEPTIINGTTATTQVNHLTHFALMAERIDTIPPTTTAILSGDQGQPKWFRSDVTVTFNIQDNEGGLGVDYTLYKLEGGDWQEYTTPLTFTNEGHYKIEFYSVDNDENIESVKSVEFDIDKILPQATIDANPKELWPPNGKMVDVAITGNSSDEHLHSTIITVEDEYNLVEPAISGFGQTIQLEAAREGSDKDGRMYIIKVVAEDLAGNTKEEQVEVIVPHDQRENS